MSKLAQRAILNPTLFTVDNVTGEETPIIKLDSLKLVGLDAKTTTTEVRGGEGSALLTIFESNYDVDVNLQDAVWRPKMSSLVANTGLITHSTTNRKEIYETEVIKIAQGATGTGLEYTLKKTPKRIISAFKSDDGLDYTNKLTKASGAPATANEYAVAADKLTFHTDIAASSDATIIIDYTYEVEEGQTFTLDFARFSNCTFKLVGRTLFRDVAKDGCFIDRVGQVVIPRLFLLSTQKFEFRGEGEAQVFDIAGKIIKPANSNTIMEITYV